MSLKEIKMLIAIVARGKGDEVTAFLRDKGIFLNTILLGKGTDTSRQLDVMGIGDVKKDIVISAMGADKIKQTMQDLAIKFRLEEVGKGVAFAININSVSGKSLLKYITGTVEENEDLWKLI